MFASEKQVRLLEQQRTQVEQLRREAAVTRSKGIYNNICSISWKERHITARVKNFFVQI